MPGYRWRICAVLFLATTVNYIDRNVLSFAMIDSDFRVAMLGLPEGSTLSDSDTQTFKKLMGRVDFAFKIAYAFGFLGVGYLIDKIGTRKGFSLSILIWSLAGLGNGFIASVKGLAVTRFILGLGESGNFPSAIKTVSEWFPKKERSLATGIFNAGSNIGIILTALAVPAITITYGWRAAFIITGSLGLVVLLIWRYVYTPPAQNSKVAKTELEYINADNDKTTVGSKSWMELLSYRQTWAFALGKMFTDPIWYFYLTWLPDFFNSSETLSYKLDLKNIGIPFLVIYLISDAGSIFFGWFSSYLIRKGLTINRARKITMLICACCVVPIFFASVTASIYVAVGLIALAAAAHQGWSANLFTTASDMFPKQYLGSVVGIGSMMGSLSGALFAYFIGDIRVAFGYVPLFAVAACAYLLGLAIFQLLSPKLEGIEK